MGVEGGQLFKKSAPEIDGKIIKKQINIKINKLINLFAIPIINATTGILLVCTKEIFAEPKGVRIIILATDNNNKSIGGKKKLKELTQEEANNKSQFTSIQ